MGITSYDMAEQETLESEAVRTNRVRDQGAPNGLFRASMNQIETDHTIGQKLRGLMLAAGLMTDARCYAELLGQFYLCTEVLESRLYAPAASEMPLLQTISKLGYHFVEGYEADLQHLLGDDWRALALKQATPPCTSYVAQLRQATQEELAAAAFILWGPMVIGGGAMLKPRVKKAFGIEATNVFEDVVGAGRAERQRRFIEAFDGMCVEESENGCFDRVVVAVGELMKGNNDMMFAVRQSAWWAKYVYAGSAALVLFTGWAIWGQRGAIVHTRVAS